MQNTPNGGGGAVALMGGAPRAIGELRRTPRVRRVPEPEIARRVLEATDEVAKDSCRAEEGYCVAEPLVSSPVSVKVRPVGFVAMVVVDEDIALNTR